MLTGRVDSIKPCYKMRPFRLALKFGEYDRKSVSLQCVFHSIRFKVNKRLAVWDR